MQLPKDNNNWTDKHLPRIENALYNAFDRYEKASGVDVEKADQHYEDYLHLVEQAENLRLVLNKPRVLYP